MRTAEQIDFIGAFLNGDLQEDNYIEVPEELSKLACKNQLFSKLAAKHGYDPDGAQVIYLKKALYGLKQSPRTWQRKLHHLWQNHGFEPLASDSAVYVSLEHKTFIITFVDDYLIIGPNFKFIRALKGKIGNIYAVEDRGPASYFLGFEIVRDRPNRRLFITQRNYISEVLKLFNYDASVPINVPLPPGLMNDVNCQFTYLKGVPLSKSDVKLYQKIIRCCMYAIIQSRLDIAFAVQFLSRSLQNPL